MITLTESIQMALNENLGTFDGLLDICEYCAQAIYSACNGAEISTNEEYNIKVSKDDLEGMSNVFFKEIQFNIIFVDTQNKFAQYVPNAKLDKRTNLFNKIEVNIFIDYTKEIEPYEICNSLLHELTHAYQDYKMKLKGTDYFAKLAQFYADAEVTDDADDIRNTIRQALYLSLSVEKAAFIAQFQAELELSKKPIYTPVDAMEVLRETDAYKFFCEMKNFIEEYKKGNLEDDAIKTITDEYNRISKTNYMPQKVFKKLEFLMDKAIKKFDRVIEKLCIERYS